MGSRIRLPAALFILALFADGVSSAAPYVNHTVGGDAGWVFNQTSNRTNVDYEKWAAKETFSLGDYLIFQTNGNSTVLQTAVEADYAACDPSAESLVTYGGGGTAGDPDTISVPLTLEGSSFFLSDAFDGQQCEKGMRFKIKVLHGNGLPPDLLHPPPPPYLPLASPPPAVPSGSSTQQQSFYRGAASRRSEIGWGIILGMAAVILAGANV